MADGKRILAVDAGNSRVKWAMYDGRAFVSEDWSRTDDMDRLGFQWQSLGRPHQVVIANVAGDGAAEKLTRLCAQWNLLPVWAEGKKHQCGVSNSYDNPAELGPDRWAALIGAHALAPRHRVVACMGTATTVNALTAEGVFLGGMILPGFDMMHDLLSRKTARLGAERGELRTFPRSTRDAITTGAVRATCGAIEYMYELMQREGYRDVSILATGGAASVLAGTCKYPVVVEDKLVLAGLVQIGADIQRPAVDPAT